MATHKHIAALIPFRRTAGGVEVHLQKKDNEAPNLPDEFAFWGGGVESGESAEQAMLREIKEELEWTPQHYMYVGQYKSGPVAMDVFASEVGDDFEPSITVTEGEYGLFFTPEEIETESRLQPAFKQAVRDLLSIVN